MAYGDPKKKKKPVVTEANKKKYTDYHKKNVARFGVGAVGEGPGGKLSDTQKQVGKQVVEQNFSKTGQYNYDTSTQAGRSPESINAAQRAANKTYRETSTFSTPSEQRLARMYKDK